MEEAGERVVLARNEACPDQRAGAEIHHAQRTRYPVDIKLSIW